jgi:hypothetical protein
MILDRLLQSVALIARYKYVLQSTECLFLNTSPT